jgi:hypothetical protein
MILAHSAIPFTYFIYTTGDRTAMHRTNLFTFVSKAFPQDVFDVARSILPVEWQSLRMEFTTVHRRPIYAAHGACLMLDGSPSPLVFIEYRPRASLPYRAYFASVIADGTLFLDEDEVYEDVGGYSYPDFASCMKAIALWAVERHLDNAYADAAALHYIATSNHNPEESA